MEVLVANVVLPEEPEGRVCGLIEDPEHCGDLFLLELTNLRNEADRIEACKKYFKKELVSSINDKIFNIDPNNKPARDLKILKPTLKQSDWDFMESEIFQNFWVEVITEANLHLDRFKHKNSMHSQLIVFLTTCSYVGGNISDVFDIPIRASNLLTRIFLVYGCVTDETHYARAVSIMACLVDNLDAVNKSNAKYTATMAIELMKRVKNSKTPLNSMIEELIAFANGKSDEFGKIFRAAVLKGSCVMAPNDIWRVVIPLVFVLTEGRPTAYFVNVAMNAVEIVIHLMALDSIHLKFLGPNKGLVHEAVEEFNDRYEVFSKSLSGTNEHLYQRIKRELEDSELKLIPRYDEKHEAAYIDMLIAGVYFRNDIESIARILWILLHNEWEESTPYVNILKHTPPLDNMSLSQVPMDRLRSIMSSIFKPSNPNYELVQTSVQSFFEETDGKPSNEECMMVARSVYIFSIIIIPNPISYRSISKENVRDFLSILSGRPLQFFLRIILRVQLAKNPTVETPIKWLTHLLASHKQDEETLDVLSELPIEIAAASNAENRIKSMTKGSGIWLILFHFLCMPLENVTTKLRTFVRRTLLYTKWMEYNGVEEKAAPKMESFLHGEMSEERMSMICAQYIFECTTFSQYRSKRMPNNITYKIFARTVPRIISADIISLGDNISKIVKIIFDVTVTDATGEHEQSKRIEELFKWAPIITPNGFTQYAVNFLTSVIIWIHQVTDLIASTVALALCEGSTIDEHTQEKYTNFISGVLSRRDIVTMESKTRMDGKLLREYFDKHVHLSSIEFYKMLYSIEKDELNSSISVESLILNTVKGRMKAFVLYVLHETRRTKLYEDMMRILLKLIEESDSLELPSRKIRLKLIKEYASIILGHVNTTNEKNSLSESIEEACQHVLNELSKVNCSAFLREALPTPPGPPSKPPPSFNAKFTRKIGGLF